MRSQQFILFLNHDDTEEDEYKVSFFSSYSPSSVSSWFRNESTIIE